MSTSAVRDPQSLLVRGVWLAPWRFAGSPVYVAVNGRGDFVAWSIVADDQRAVDVEAALWVALNRADPPSQGQSGPVRLSNSQAPRFLRLEKGRLT